jgi:hypothetical protein
MVARRLRNFFQLFALPLLQEAEHRITQLSIQISGRRRVPARQQPAMKQLDCTHISELVLRRVMVQHHQYNFIPTCELVQQLACLAATRRSGTESLEPPLGTEGQLPATRLLGYTLRQERQPEMERAPKVCRTLRLCQELQVQSAEPQLVIMQMDCTPRHAQQAHLEQEIKQPANSRFSTEQLLRPEQALKVCRTLRLYQEAQLHQVELRLATMQMVCIPLRELQTEVVKAQSSCFSYEPYTGKVRLLEYKETLPRTATAIGGATTNDSADGKHTAPRTATADGQSSSNVLQLRTTFDVAVGSGQSSEQLLQERTIHREAAGTGISSQNALYDIDPVTGITAGYWGIQALIS